MPKGYAQIKSDGKTWLFHRLMWTITYGDIPEGMQVCHHCDNRKCGNPEHLFLGTNQDNVTDMIQKGRNRRGETHHNAKLTDVDVIQIRTSGMNYKELAEKYDVHPNHILSIRSGRRR